MTIRSHLVLLVCAALLPMLIFAALLSAWFWSAQSSASDQRFLERVRALSIAIDTEIEASIRVLDSLKQSPEIEANDIARFSAKAGRALSSQPQWSSLELRSISGKVLYFAGMQQPGREAFDAVALERAVAGKRPAVSGLVHSGAGNKYWIEIAVPVVHEEAVTHLLIARIDQEAWLRLLSRLPILSNATITLLDRDAIIIARTLNNDRWVGKPATSELAAKAKLMPEGAYRSTGLEGQAFYSAHRRSPLWGWTVATGVPAVEVERPMRDSTLALVGAAVLSAGLAIWLAIIVGRRIAGPVAALASSVKALETGGPATRSEQIRGISEVEEVASAFAQTGQLLQQREQALSVALGGEQRARAEAEAANRGKDQFLAMLGHELRNPLSAISNAVALGDRVDAGSELAVRARDVVRRQLGNLRRLVDDLLDVARVTTGKIALQSTPLELTAVVRRSIAALKDARRLADHEVQLALDQAWVCADDTRLEQIVCNLVENAAKYTPPGGNIRVSVRREDANAVLEVSDTGRGISADLLPRVFDLFTQDERTLDRSQGGLGLGLSLVRRLVELHHGTVTAASEGPGKGATFVVRLPQIEAPVFVAAPTQSAPARTKRRRILVIEDNVDGRDALKELLQGQGHEVHTAGDGPAGVEEALAVSPEVVLIDIGLPGFDGYEVARRLRASTQGKHLKLIALTGYGQEEDVKRARDVGFDDYLVKPVEMNVLESVCAAA